MPSFLNRSQHPPAETCCEARNLSAPHRQIEAVFCLMLPAGLFEERHRAQASGKGMRLTRGHSLSGADSLIWRLGLQCDCYLLT